MSNKQEVCLPVAQEIGTPPEPEFFTDDMQPIFTETAENVAATHAWDETDIENGKAAERALMQIGCDACKLSEVCMVKSTLEEKVQAGQEMSDFMDTATQLASAPRWLSAARLNRTGTDISALQEVLTDPDKTQAAMENGTIDLHQMLGGVQNHPEGMLTKKDLPELATANIKEDALLAAHDIETDDGQHFSIIDASEAVGFKDAPLSAHDYGILAGKLLGRMTETDAKGEPQILSPDNIMQKALFTLPNGSRLDEIRMSGKNRFYLAITPGTDEQPPRITIMGSHGGDAATQRTFIDALNPQK